MTAVVTAARRRLVTGMTWIITPTTSLYSLHTLI